MPEEYRSDADGIGDVPSGNTIDPGSYSGEAPAAEPVRKRRKRSDAGVPRGTTGPRTKAAQANVDLSSLTGLFVGLHAAIATATNTPEWAMSEDEGNAFMKSAQNVMRHYSVTTTQKTIDWLAFMGVTAQIYGTRIMAIRFRMAEEHKHRRPSATVHPLRPEQQQSQPPAQNPTQEFAHVIVPDIGAGDAAE